MRLSIRAQLHQLEQRVRQLEAAAQEKETVVEASELPGLPRNFMALTKPVEEPEPIVARAVDILANEAQIVFTYAVRELTYEEGYGKCRGRKGEPMHWGVIRMDQTGASMLVKRSNTKESAIVTARGLSNRNIRTQRETGLLRL